MTIKEFLKYVERVQLDTFVINQAEQIYGKIDSELVKKIFSINLTDSFIESEDFLRVLTKDEILNAISDLHVDFKKKKIIPFFDIGDNDFIVYHLATNKWSYMNIVDGVCFSESNSLEELLR